MCNNTNRVRSTRLRQHPSRQRTKLSTDKILVRKYIYRVCGAVLKFIHGFSKKLRPENQQRLREAVPEVTVSQDHQI
ncbi:hypothetical protein L596_001340 [Steinernema carpocapsae]|uniref:Uncharacterized protein n=1 Tax=Steinernema carpocapsae TaxID=34508 RepID=A0A4U8UQ04_STECR|nr:hypothetical protein L596_001340 [Steinernema carpocapsae]